MTAKYLIAAALTMGLGASHSQIEFVSGDARAATASKCPRDHVILENDVAQLTRARVVPDGLPFLTGCLHAVGREYNYGDDSITGAEALNGSAVVYTAHDCDDDFYERCRVMVRAEDMATVQQVTPDERAVTPPGPRDRFNRVGSARVRRNLALAFIACAGGPGGDLVYSRKPNCTRPGRSRNVVFAYGSEAKKLRRLDSGRRIDPTSLRLSGSRISWLHGDKRRRATLK